MVVRSQQMSGRDARYIPAGYCHGLPIEWKIEGGLPRQGAGKDKVDVVGFPGRKCRRFAEGWIDVQREEFKRLGITGTWDKPYLTMDFHAERVIAEEFQKFLMNGSLYQGSKPVMWSPVEKTALAEAEVEYHDRQTDAVWVPFEVTGYVTSLPAPLTEGDDLVPTPDSRKPYETIMGVKGRHLDHHPMDPAAEPARSASDQTSSYGLYEITGTPDESWAKTGDRYLLADRLAEEALGAMRLEPSMYSRFGKRGPQAALVVSSCDHPLRGTVEPSEPEQNRLGLPRSPSSPADHVTDDAGTGFVHTAPSHWRRRLRDRAQARARDDV